jgi:Reverse transcriptase (RNA-dependent DNA polymerase)
MINFEDYPWLKSKGYLHITPKINVFKNTGELIRKIMDPEFVANYSFYPLIHSIIVERRYRKDTKRQNKRYHTKRKNDENVPNAKKRPLHYATHMDALIFAYYAHLLNQRYEEEVAKYPNLYDSVTAYRKIPIDGQKSNKGTIHFAHDVFQYVKKRTEIEPVVVLKFDIESFFNQMDHELLLSKWHLLFQDGDRLPSDHFNVFQAATKFSYILKDDLRVGGRPPARSRRKGFDEKKLAKIRNQLGSQAFFESPADFRSALKSGKLRVFKYPFKSKKTKRICGIPQGLPVSSVLANLYLIDFDKKMIDLCQNVGGFYRRYSDDIIVVCKQEEREHVQRFANDTIEECQVSLSEDKTEVFLFRKAEEKSGRVVSYKMVNSKWVPDIPLTYLGFEFFGYRTAIKSANLAKFYRRMIKSAKRKCFRATKIAKADLQANPTIFYRQLYRLYTLLNLSKSSVRAGFVHVVPAQKSQFQTKFVPAKRNINYLNYVARAASIMGEEGIWRQLRRHKAILRKAIRKNIIKAADRDDH